MAEGVMIFEKASRLKLKFETNRGLMAVEDLWDLPLQSRTGRPNLDDLAISLNRKLSETGVSFVETERKTDEETQLRFDIVRHVINIKKDENKQAEAARERAEKKQRIMELISKKQDEALEAQGLESLQALLATL